MSSRFMALSAASDPQRFVNWFAPLALRPMERPIVHVRPDEDNVAALTMLRQPVVKRVDNLDVDVVRRTVLRDGAEPGEDLASESGMPGGEKALDTFKQHRFGHMVSQIGYDRQHQSAAGITNAKLASGGAEGLAGETCGVEVHRRHACDISVVDIVIKCLWFPVVEKDRLAWPMIVGGELVSKLHFQVLERLPKRLTAAAIRAQCDRRQGLATLPPPGAQGLATLPPGAQGLATLLPGAGALASSPRRRRRTSLSWGLVVPGAIPTRRAPPVSHLVLHANSIAAGGANAWSRALDFGWRCDGDKDKGRDRESERERERERERDVTAMLQTHYSIIIVIMENIFIFIFIYFYIYYYDIIPILLL